MKNPLHYQLSEYDCGPTSLLNAISFLFEREEIPPEILRNIMLYCLDCYGPEGSAGKSGTSCTAMMFLSNWLQGLGDIGKLPVSSRYLRGSDVYVGDNSLLLDALRRGGAVVVRLYYEVAHYVLFTGVEDRRILLFDPYYQTVPFTKPDEKEALLITDHPFSWNRSVPFSYFNRESMELYALGEMAGREAVLLFNRNTVLTEEATIEYFI
ncbi:peptidase C39 [Clostridium sp.]